MWCAADNYNYMYQTGVGGVVKIVGRGGVGKTP